MNEDSGRAGPAPGESPEESVTPVAVELEEVPTEMASLQIVLLPDDQARPSRFPRRRPLRRGRHGKQ